MPLTTGERLGSYEILSPLGVGGMGEVYRARDTRLARDVAIKILPAAVAADPDRIARFKREAQLLASLNHPNIAAIYGLEESSGLTALVLECVDGPTLADRIAQGPIAIDEACHIARQIADALEAAHAQGIVHRDLKPANIKLTADDKVKVLDFGLAKALDPSGVGSVSDASISPTLTSPTMTRAGVILGTAAYMAPEQARGKVVDKRADIWAFGCVLYEMLTGRRAFASDEVTDTLAMVLMKDVNWSALPPATPPGVRRLLRRCLERDRSHRLADVADARLELEDALAPGVDAAPAGAGQAPPIARWRRALPWTIAAVALLALAGALLRAPESSPEPPPLVPARMELTIGADTVVTALALSPDGATLATVGPPTRPGSAQLYVRRMNELEARPLSGTEGANFPFFSPDGQWIGFFSGGKLKKVAVSGGAVVTLCDVQGARGGTWSASDTIIFNPGSTGGPAPLLEVPAAGGVPRPFTTLATAQQADRWPQALPQGRGILYTSANVVRGFNEGSIMVRPLQAGEPKEVYRGGYFGRYLPGGYLSFIRDGTLFAATFDLDRLELTGPPVPLLERVQVSPQLGSAVIDASANGTLVYLPAQGDPSSSAAPIAWLDRAGKFTLLRSTPGVWGTPQFSPDGAKLAFSLIEQDQTDIWTYEWARDIASRLTVDAASDAMPVWTPDGDRVAFGSFRSGAVLNLYWQRADGSGAAQRLTESNLPQLPGSFHPNGRLLAYHQGQGGDIRQDILVVPIEGDETKGWKPGKPVEFLGGAFRKVMPMFSPDGKWMAYASNETGRFEVYVTPYPGPGPKWQVSNQGGSNPRWSRVKPELFFSQGGSGVTIMVARYSTVGNVFRAEKPSIWTGTVFPNGAPINIYGSHFALHPDGQRFAVPQPLPSANRGVSSRLVVVFNALEEIKKHFR